MPEYIEREAISEGIRKYYYKNPPNSSYEEGFDRGLDRAQRAILDAPAADVAPVVHGRWMDNEDYMFCSCCGMQWNYCDNDTEDFHYCPNCGCRMDGDDDK